MRQSIESWLSTLSATALLLAAPGLSAHAQQRAPEGGDVVPADQAQGQYGDPAQGGVQAEGSWQPPTGQMQPQPAPGQPMPDGSMGMPMPMADDGTALPPEPVDGGGSDHSAVVGRFGVGFFGVLAVPVMDCDTTMALCAFDIEASVSAPTVGARYWLGEGLGIEAALGLNITSGEFGALQTGAFAFALHGGVPLALAHSGHFVFEVVPQLNFGIASGSFEIPGTTADTSGMLIEAGAKAGAEIHFGFIDIPELSLQGSVGVLVRHESRSVDTTVATAAAPPTTATVEQSETFFGTGVDGEPWDVFTGSIAAIYYF